MCRVARVSYLFWCSSPCMASINSVLLQKFMFGVCRGVMVYCQLRWCWRRPSGKAAIMVRWQSHVLGTRMYGKVHKEPTMTYALIVSSCDGSINWHFGPSSNACIELIYCALYYVNWLICLLVRQHLVQWSYFIILSLSLNSILLSL